MDREDPVSKCCHQMVAWVMLLPILIVEEKCLGRSLRTPSNRDALPKSVLPHYPPT